MFKRTAPAFAAGAIFAVLVGGTGAYAATGGTFLIGKSNKATSTTTLTASRGPALALGAKGPALKVNNNSKIGNLNADLLDGKSAEAFAPAGGRSYSYEASGTLIDVDSNGLTDLIGAAATCPAGTQLTGGGVTDFTPNGWFIESAPDTEGDQVWYGLIGIDETATPPSASLVTAYVTCWSPTGAHLGSFARTTRPSDIGADLRASVRAKVAAHR